MPQTRWLVVALVGCIALGVYTSFKLHRMNRIVEADGASERRPPHRRVHELARVREQPDQRWSDPLVMGPLA